MKSKSVILVYGTQNDIDKDLEQVDVTDLNWVKKIPETGKVLCHKSAYIYAIKYLPSIRLAHTKEELFEAETKFPEKKEEVIQTTGIAAAVSDNIVVSAKYHKAVESNSIWMSPYQVGMVNKMLGVGCKITLLDEENHVVKELEEK